MARPMKQTLMKQKRRTMVLLSPLRGLKDWVLEAQEMITTTTWTRAHLSHPWLFHQFREIPAGLSPKNGQALQVVHACCIWISQHLSCCVVWQVPWSATWPGPQLLEPAVLKWFSCRSCQEPQWGSSLGGQMMWTSIAPRSPSGAPQFWFVHAEERLIHK